jgi:tryptophan synthase alpha chain
MEKEPGLNRIDGLKGRKSVIIYLMAGDPDLRTTEKLIYLLAREGVSLIELGVPFSDPVADGSAIQRAGERAIKNNINITKVLNLVAKVRKKTETPIVLMLYYNIIYKYGGARFAIDAVKAGVDGVIVPDLPFDEERPFYEAAKKAGLCTIYLVAPTNSKERAKKIVEKSRGFVYYILLKGTTGVRKKAVLDFSGLKAIKKMGSKPVFAGFGVSTPKQAAGVLKQADGVIIGSAFVELVEKYAGRQKALEKNAVKFIKSFVKEA